VGAGKCVRVVGERRRCWRRVVWWGSRRVEADEFVIGWPLWDGSGCLAVFVDESAAGSVSSDRSAGLMLDNFGIVRCALTEGAVGSMRVVVPDILAEQLFEVSAVPDEGAVAELAAHGADPPFRVGVRDRCVRRCADDAGAVATEDLVERADELAGAVTDQESDRPFGTHHEVPGGSGCPGAGRIRRDAGEVHVACLEFDEEQDVVAA